MNITRLTVVLLAWLCLAPFASAQYRHELLALVPDDFGVCVVMNDLRGHSARWAKSDWMKTFRASPLSQRILESPEMQQLGRLQDDLKKHFDLDWPTLRDDVLGDTLILAYNPPSEKNPADEHGLILLHAHKPARFAQLVDRLNEGQKKSGELKSLTTFDYRGMKYHRREEPKKMHYYFLDGPLFAFTDKEDVLRAFLDRRVASPKEHAWAKRFRQANAEDALVTLCVNPRRLAVDFGPDVKEKDSLPTYWRALDAIFVTLTIRDEAELRVAIQADAQQLPRWARGAFTRTMPTSTLWQRFPERSILTVAAQTDFAGTAEGLTLLIPEAQRKASMDELQRLIGAGWLGGADLFKDVLPNLGPDWGFCVLPARKPDELPQAMFALAVRPGTKEPRIDETIFDTVQTLTKWGIASYNQNNPKSIIRLLGDKQVKYLTCDKFPAGFQPACALKDGFLIFATSPGVIDQFRLRDAETPPRKDAPLVRISTRELAQLMHQRRDHILGSLPTDRNAKQHLENVMALLNLFDQLTLSQHGEAGQSTWTLRLTPVP